MFDPSSPDRLIAGRYRVLRELGRGGMGAVYLVEHVHTGDHLALKSLLVPVGASREALERFKREARTSALLKSENVVRVTDADVAPELGGSPFLVMELLNGAAFDALVAKQGPLPPSLVVDYLLQVARAIDRAHELGIVHRDLKPGNLFLHHREDGTTIVKVLDFGISKFLEPSGLQSSLGMTNTGTLLGTPLFMSPEQASGSPHIGPSADIWAVGLIAVFLLTGEMYWRSTVLSQLLFEITMGKPPKLSARFPGRLPRAMDEWFARSCNRDPERRFATVTQQVHALAASLGLPNVDLSQSSSPSVGPPVSRGEDAGAGVLEQATTAATPLSRSLAPSLPRRVPIRRLGLTIVGVVTVMVAFAWRHFHRSIPAPVVSVSSSNVASPPVSRQSPPQQSPVTLAVSARESEAAPSSIAPALTAPSPPELRSRRRPALAAPPPAPSANEVRKHQAGRDETRPEYHPAAP